jgi:hypothetical protein
MLQIKRISKVYSNPLSKTFKSFGKKIFGKEENPISREIKDRILQLLLPQVDVSKNIGMNILKNYFSKSLKTPE